jgi:hypothetical protein
MLRLTRGGSERPVTLMVSVQEEWCQTLLTRACCRQLSCPLILVVRTGLVDILSSLSLSPITGTGGAGHSARRSASSVSTDSHADSEHNNGPGSGHQSASNRLRLDSNESIPSHSSSPRAVSSKRLQPFEEIQTNFVTSVSRYREVTYHLPKGWMPHGE